MGAERLEISGKRPGWIAPRLIGSLILIFFFLLLHIFLNFPKNGFYVQTEKSNVKIQSEGEEAPWG